MTTAQPEPRDAGSELPRTEGIDAADVDERLERGPDEQRNLTDPEQDDTQDHPGTGSDVAD